jgi:hypothetical protein
MSKETFGDSVFNMLTGLFDPLHIVVPKKASVDRLEYEKAVAAYNDKFYKLYKKKGKEWINSQKPTLRPIILMKTAGMGGGSGASSGFGGGIGAGLGLTNTGESSSYRSRENQVSEADDILDDAITRAEGKGEGKGESESEAKFERVARIHSSKKEYKDMPSRYKIKTNPITQLLESMASQTNSTFRVNGSSAEVTQAIRDVWGARNLTDEDYDFRDRILHVFNRNGFFFEGQTAADMKKKLAQPGMGASLAIIQNELAREFRERAGTDQMRDKFSIVESTTDSSFDDEAKVDFTGIFDGKKDDIIKAMKENRIPEKLAREIFEKLKNSGLSQAKREASTTFKDIMDISERRQRALSKSIKDILEQEAKANGKLKISVQGILRMVLGILNVPEDIISNVNLRDLNPRNISSSMRNAVTEEEIPDTIYDDIWRTEDPIEMDDIRRFEDIESVNSEDNAYDEFGRIMNVKGNKPDYSGQGSSEKRREKRREEKIDRMFEKVGLTEKALKYDTDSEDSENSDLGDSEELGSNIREANADYRGRNRPDYSGQGSRNESKRLENAEYVGSSVRQSLAENRRSEEDVVFNFRDFNVQYVASNRGGGGGGDDPGSFGRVIVSMGGRRRIISLVALAILLGLLGVAGKKVIDELKKGKKVDVSKRDSDEGGAGGEPQNPFSGFPKMDKQEILQKIREADAYRKRPDLSLEEKEKMDMISKLYRAQLKKITNASSYDPDAPDAVGGDYMAFTINIPEVRDGKETTGGGDGRVTTDVVNRPIMMTDQIRDAGLETMVTQYNDTLKIYEKARKSGDTRNAMGAKYTLGKLRTKIQQSSSDPNSRADPTTNLTPEREEAGIQGLLDNETDKLQQAQSNFMQDLSNLRQAISSGATPGMIENLYSRYSESQALLRSTKANYDNAAPYYQAAINNRSYLPNSSDEKFPGKNIEEVNKFNKIQQQERALKDYAANERNGNMGGAVIDYFDSYNQRLNGLNGSIGIKESDFKSKSDYYDARSKILDTVFDEFQLEQPEIEQFQPQEGILDDPDTNVQLTDYDIDPGIGYARADTVDPAEAELFLSTTRQNREQQKVFDQFSRVEPGNGLGSMGYNSLRQHNLRAAKLRFDKAAKNTSFPFRVKTRATLEREAPLQSQPTFVPIYQSDFGDVIFEDSTPYSDYQRRNQLTNERLHTDLNSEYENTNNIYMPEARLMNFRRKPVRIPEPRMNGYNYGLIGIDPSKEDVLLTSNARTGYNYTDTMRNDQMKKSYNTNNPTDFYERLSSSRNR